MSQRPDPLRMDRTAAQERSENEFIHRASRGDPEAQQKRGERSADFEGDSSGLCSPPLEGGAGDPEVLGGGANRHPLDRSEAIDGKGLLGSAEAFPFCANAGESRSDTFLNPAPLKLRQRRQDMELELPRRSAEVDPLIEADEGDPEGAQFVQQHDEVAEIPPEAIEPPHDDRVELPPPCSREELIERGAGVF